MSWIRIFPSLFIVIMLFGCGKDPLKSDVTKIEFHAEIVNLDSLLVFTPISEVEHKNSRWKKDLGDPYAYVLGRCIGIASPSDSVVASALEIFRKDTYIAQLEKDIQKEFYPVQTFSNEIDLAFKRIKFHLPKAKLPERVFFANTLFVSSAFATESDMVIGLERYLGAQNKLIQQLPPDVYFKWVTDGMQRKFLQTDLISTWTMTHIVPEVKGNLAEEMIRWGKILIVAEAALYDSAKELVLRYSKEDYEWALENEYNLWDYLKREELLFKDSEREKMNMINPGPFTVGLPEKGPDRLGQFLGWRIVHSFLEKNDVSLQTLIETPYTKILQAYEID